MNSKDITAEEIEELLVAHRDDKQRDHLLRFFKTGKGQYGEGDLFLGLKVPQTRAIVRKVCHRVEMEDIRKLLYSPWHEVRLCALLLIVEEMKINLPKKKDTEEILKVKADSCRKISEFYLANAKQANNWDLVDLSCQYILGPFLRIFADYDFSILCRLAESENLWEQRIAIVSTLDFIRNNNFIPTITICDKLIHHPHDLIHKAMGWVLREIGKKDKEVLTSYLEKNYSRLPRTSLRYAIERMPEPERLFWLKRE